MPTITLPSPIGTLRLEADARALTRLSIGGAEEADDPSPLLTEARAQLLAYLAGRLTSFDLPLAPAATPRGGVLRDAIRAVPHGETITYGALAQVAESSPRAIGQACRRNPLPLIVPCHRVLSAGAAQHYSAGDGPRTKTWLLDHERRR